MILLSSVSCNKEPKTEIVFFDPIQCLGNPWEIQWLETHTYEEYPQNEVEQLKIFTDYYQDRGVNIYDVYVENLGDIVCAACFCSNGQRIFCLIDKDDADFMLASGFSYYEI